ncbi:hypothetical protein PWY87_13590 [Kribbella solani]|uniref:hypothetical protein n=1 Tax=Kribbella solani TaxID=236067 RepID=UPI0029B28B58|nr:hypothetical protein [Kribbella solani]MDX3002714.1 hypothetical protein [Kribbella solani]
MVVELAAVIGEDEQRRGLGVRMLSIAAADAIAAGATHFLFVVSAANERSIRMIRRRWPNATVERDGTLLNFLAPAQVPAKTPPHQPNHPTQPAPTQPAPTPPTPTPPPHPNRTRANSPRPVRIRPKPSRAV